MDDINVMLDVYVDFMIIVAITFLMLKGLVSGVITDQMTVRVDGMCFLTFPVLALVSHKPHLCGLQRWTLETYDKAKKKKKPLKIYLEMAGGDTTIITFCMKLSTVCSNYLQLDHMKMTE